MKKIFWATTSMITKPSTEHTTTISYALGEKSKNIIEFIIDSTVLSIEKQMKNKIRLSTIDGYNLKDVKILVDLTMIKTYKIVFIGYINNDKDPILGVCIEHPCTLEIIEKIMKCPGFYEHMAEQIQEKITLKGLAE